MFSLEFSIQADKFLRKCEKELAIRIIEKINLLATDPAPHHAIRVAGEKKIFRIRIGDYRVLYEVVWETQAIVVAKIDNRSRVYQ